MPARTSTAFILSVLLHAAAVVILLMVAFAAQRNKPPPVVIFDLVAGPGNDLTATKAPALGTPDGDLAVKVPEPPAPRHETVSEPVAPPAPVESVKPATRRPTRTEPAAKPAAEEASRMTYAEYVKQHGKPAASRGAAASTPRMIAVPRINGRGIAAGVLGGSPDSKGGGGGTAMTAAVHSALDGYISRLVTALRQNHEKPPGLSDLLSADVEFFIAADGTISRVRISRSSGNAAFDASCIDAFHRIGSIGPKPDGKSDTWELTFRMKDEE